MVAAVVRPALRRAPRPRPRRPRVDGVHAAHAPRRVDVARRAHRRPHRHGPRRGRGLPGDHRSCTRGGCPPPSGRAVARMLSGIPLGTVVGLLATGWLLGRYPWSAAFYPFGALGVVWVALWSRRRATIPATTGAWAPRSAPCSRRSSSPRAPRRRRRRWASSCATRRCGRCSSGTSPRTGRSTCSSTWLPSYFRDVQHSSIAGDVGILSAAPWLAMFASANVAGASSPTAGSAAG